MYSVMKNDGLSQVKMAKILGVSNASVSHFISGRNNPGLEVIKNFSRHYSEVDLNWLLMGVGKKNLADSPEAKASSLEGSRAEGIDDSQPNKVIMVYKNESFVILNPKK